MKENKDGLLPITRRNRIRKLEKHINSHRHGTRIGNPNDERAIDTLKELKHK